MCFVRIQATLIGRFVSDTLHFSALFLAGEEGVNAQQEVSSQKAVSHRNSHLYIYFNFMTSCCRKPNHKRNETQICTQSFNVVLVLGSTGSKGEWMWECGGNVATAAGDSGKAVQFVEIRNFARHHQRETFPTSWVAGWLGGLDGCVVGAQLSRHDGEMRAGAWRINTHTNIVQTLLSLSRTLL